MQNANKTTMSVNKAFSLDKMDKITRSDETRVRCDKCHSAVDNRFDILRSL